MGVGETYSKNDVWWGEFTGAATGPTLNFLFLLVNFLFFLFYNLATPTTAQKRNCKKSLRQDSGHWPNPAVHDKNLNTENETLSSIHPWSCDYDNFFESDRQEAVAKDASNFGIHSKKRKSKEKLKDKSSCSRSEPDDWSSKRNWGTESWVNFFFLTSVHFF